MNKVLPVQFGGERSSVPRNEMEDQLRDFINGELIMRSAMSGPSINGYLSVNDFIVGNGCFYDFKPLPKGISKGAERQCFANTLRLCADRTDLTYCEGIAQHAGCIMPTYHAWAITKEGVVIDPTWVNGAFLNKRAYLGVPISLAFAIESGFSGHSIAIIDQWQQEWPMLRLSPEIWLPSVKEAA